MSDLRTDEPAEGVLRLRLDRPAKRNAVDRGKPFPNHTVLLGADVLLIENVMRVPELPADGFSVIAFPIRIAGENGAPARVVAELAG